MVGNRAELADFGDDAVAQWRERASSGFGAGRDGNEPGQARRSAQRIEPGEWLVVAELPAEEAEAPLRALRQRIDAVAWIIGLKAVIQRCRS